MTVPSEDPVLTISIPAQARRQVSCRPWFCDNPGQGTGTPWPRFWRKLEELVNSRRFNFSERMAYFELGLDSKAARKRFQDNITYPGSTGISIEQFYDASSGNEGMADFMKSVMSMTWSDWKNGGQGTGEYTRIAQSPPGEFIIKWRIGLSPPFTISTIPPGPGHEAGRHVTIAPLAALQGFTDGGATLTALQKPDQRINNWESVAAGNGFRKLHGTGGGLLESFLDIGTSHDPEWNIDSHNHLNLDWGRVVGYQMRYPDWAPVHSARFLFREFPQGCPAALEVHAQPQRTLDLSFLSFTRSDNGQHQPEELVGHLHRSMDNIGILSFMDGDAIAPGTPWADKLEVCVSVSKVFVIILTPEYPKRYWPMRELDIALNSGPRDRVVIPILLGVEIGQLKSPDEDWQTAWKECEESKPGSANAARWKANLAKLAALNVVRPRPGHLKDFAWLETEVVETTKEHIAARA